MGPKTEVAALRREVCFAPMSGDLVTMRRGVMAGIEAIVGKTQSGKAGSADAAVRRRARYGRAIRSHACVN
jgi:hypothetical protein